MAHIAQARYALLALLLAAWLLDGARAMAGARCNQHLLSSFKLVGLEYATNGKMMICPMVTNRCCNLMDEVRIVQLWQMFGQQQIRGFSGKVVQLFQSFYQLHSVYSKLKIEDMVFHYLSFNRMRPMRQMCTQSTHTRRLRRWGKFMELQRMFPGMGPVRRFGTNNRFKHLVKTIKNMLISEVNQFFGILPSERRLLLKDPKHKKEVTRKAKKELQTFMQAPIKRFLKAQKDFRIASDDFQKRSENTEKIVHSIPGKRVKMNSKKLKSDLETTTAALTPSAAAEKSNVKPHKNRATRAQRRLQNIVIFVPTGRSYLNSFRFFTRMRVPYIPVNTEVPMITCRNVPLPILKPFLVLNQDKYLYCQSMIEKLRKINPNESLQNMENVKGTLTAMLELKKSLYCSICDATQQHLFDLGRGMVLYTQEFCYDLLTKYKDYIMFKNVQFVEFVDTMLQLQECSQSTGDENTFPNVNRFSWMRRRIPFIKRCYDNLDSKDFYVYCRFMCVQYRLQDFSNFFEADIRTMETVYASMMSFVRSQRVTRNFDSEPHELHVPRPTPQNSTAGAQAGLDEEEQQLNVYVSNGTGLSLSEEYIKGEIFEKVKKRVPVSELRSVFVQNVHGLNPISVFDHIDFRVEIQDILVEEAKKTEGEELEINALQGYFESKNNMIRDFNENIDLEFKETIARVTPQEKLKHEVERLKRRQKRLAQKPVSTVPTEKEPMNIPDWNEDFSPPENEDKISHWFNFLFH